MKTIKAKVVLLRAENKKYQVKKGDLFINDSRNRDWGSLEALVCERVTKDGFAWNGYGIQTDINHLYFVNDEKIEEGDWVLNLSGFKYNEQIISKCSKNAAINWKDNMLINGGTKSIRDCIKKIVATTDKSLVYNQIDVKEVQGVKMEASYHKELPQIPQSFIKQYVESGGSIDEVEIEYTDWCDYDDDNTWGGLDKADLRIKLDSNNCVIVHSIKDSWSRGEVEILVAKAFKVGYDKSYTGFPYIEKHLGPAIKSWIKENMK